VNSAIVVGSDDRHLTAMLGTLGLRVMSVPEETAMAAFARAQAETLLVVDARGRSAVPAWIPAFRRQYPSSPLLMVLSAFDSALILEAMRSGVNECLAEPLTDADLEAAVLRLQALRATSAPGQVFAFLGAKGGVGTTTTAVNIATALAGLPAPTLFMDLHLAHGDAAVFLGVEPRFSVVDALENMNRLDAAYFKGLVARAKSGPDLLASSDRAFVGAAAVQQVRQLVEFAARQYRYTVLDVPRAEAATLDALDLATRIVIVANQELATVRNASRIAEALRRRYGKERVSVLLTRYDVGSQIGQEDVERVTGTRVTGTVPNDYRLALEALNSGRPVMVENHNKLAASFRHLAHKLAGTKETEDSTDSPSGLFNRLLGRRS
jgi:pilus assembly protein CpaE